jgi:flavin-dependent dehydrogenase
MAFDFSCCPSTYDVAIVGAGPAGSAAAIRCVAEGLRVVLLESESFPRERPGESMHPGVESLLDQLGVASQVREADFLRHGGIWIERNLERQFRAFGSGWQGFQAKRSHFDSILLERANTVGVKVEQPCRARSPICAGSRVVGLNTARGPIQARFVLDATGAKRWLARCLQIELRQESPRFLAVYGYATGHHPGLSEPIFRFLDDGWLWTAHVEANRYHYTRLVRTVRVDTSYFPPEFAGLQQSDRPKTRDVTWRIASRCAGPGYFILGDAAALIDPSSSQGVLRALLSGTMAAHLLTNIFAGRIPEILASQEYDIWMQRLFKRQAIELRRYFSGNTVEAVH